MIDVCFILEGTYPYLTGGVSTWVQTLLTGLPDLNFAVIHLAAAGRAEKQVRYQRPPNLRQFIEWPVALEPEAGRPALSRPVPPARIYHALSTGFAGMLGCQIKAVSARPLILTEHGIYWRELAAGADELECGFRLTPAGSDQINLQPLRRHWTIKLQDMARQVYRQADAIATVCQANVIFQTQLDAPPTRSLVIPNSIDWQAAAPTSPRSPAGEGLYRIGFVGRVVSIKDVLTFLKACRLAAAELPRSEFYVIGPMDHDPAYVARCQALVRELALEEKVTFTGETDPRPWYQQLDVVALTSLSEGQPLVLLEAMAAGTPIIATAVGGCPELVSGATPADQALGPAGRLTLPEDPAATAAAIVDLCLDRKQWLAASQAGQERARRFYTPERLCQAYRSLYGKWL